MQKVQALLNVPSKTNDTTCILQALSKLISEKLNMTAVNANLSKSSNTSEKSQELQINVEMRTIDLGFDTKGLFQENNLTNII